MQPGDPAFIDRLEIRLQAQGSDFVSPQVFLLDPAQQETATLEVAVPDTARTTFEVLISAFTSQGIEAPVGKQAWRVARPMRWCYCPASLSSPCPPLLPICSERPSVLRMAPSLASRIAGHIGDWHVCRRCGRFCPDGQRVHGERECDDWLMHLCRDDEFFPPGQGLQVGDQVVMDPCQTDAIDRRLIVTNATVSLTPPPQAPR